MYNCQKKNRYSCKLNFDLIVSLILINFINISIYTLSIMTDQMSHGKSHCMDGQQEDGQPPKNNGDTPHRSKPTIENATPIAGSSCAPPAKKRRLEFEENDNSNNQGDIEDILELLSNDKVMSVLDNILSESGSSTTSQTTFSQNANQNSKNTIKKENSSINKVFSIKPIVVDIMKYLEIKDIVCNRKINKFMKNLLHFKFVCDNFNVYFEYSSKMMVDTIVKHQICNEISNIALWYFASLNRTVGRPIFEREKAKENDNKIQFNAFGKNDINNEKLYICSINCQTKDEIKKYNWSLSSLLPKFSMNEKTGECAVLPFREMYTQMKNVKEKVKELESSEEKPVFGDVVSLYSLFVFALCVIVLLFVIVSSCKDCTTKLILMLNTNQLSHIFWCLWHVMIHL